MKTIGLAVILASVTACTSTPAELPYCRMGTGEPNDKALPIFNTTWHSGEDPVNNVLRITQVDIQTQKKLGQAIVMTARGWDTWPVNNYPCADGVFLSSKDQGMFLLHTCADRTYTVMGLNPKWKLSKE